MTLVVDASVVVAALVDSSPLGVWAESVLLDGDLYAPSLLSVETANVLRRMERAGRLDRTRASFAFASFQRLPWHEVPFGPCADRVWELRHNLTAYDAWYVAVAELLDAPLATADGRLAHVPGIRCRMQTWSPEA